MTFAFQSIFVQELGWSPARGVGNCLTIFAFLVSLEERQSNVQTAWIIGGSGNCTCTVRRIDDTRDYSEFSLVSFFKFLVRSDLSSPIHP